MKKLTQTFATLVALALAAGTVLAEETRKDAPAAAPVTKPETVQPVTSPTDPMAKVNGAVITRGDVARTVKALLARNPQGQNLPPEIMKQAEETTLDNLISAELLYQAGAKLEIKDLDKQVEDKVGQNKSRFPSPADFEQALKTAGLTEKELVDFTRKDIVINNLIQKEIATKVDVSDDEAKKFYTENIDRFKQQESVKASHILVGVDPKATAEEKTKAKEKAEALLKKVKAGEDFAALAKKESTCPSSAQGGDLGFFSKGQMVAPFEKAAFALKPGEISDVVETQFGYHIIKVTEHKDGETAKFDDTKDKLKEYLKGQKTQKAVTDYIAALKTKANVEKLTK
jgi:peptidyl-prolyl cis-trans isomerase C